LPLTFNYTGSKKRQIEEIRLTASGNPPAERVLPAIGPPWASTAETPLLAELVLDADRAVCVRLSAGSGLTELTGVRLPLSTSGDGAEVSVVLWSNKDAGSLEPVTVLPNGASAPVSLTASSGGEEVWTRFAFAKPVPLDKNNPPWVAVLVSRGTLTWAIASSPVVTVPSTTDDALVESNLLRRGAPNGPWRALPPPFESAELIQARGRIRMIGTSTKEAPVPPVLVREVGTTTAMTAVFPSTKGVPVVIAGNAVLDSTHSDPVLLVVSRAIGAITLRDIDIVWNEE